MTPEQLAASLIADCASDAREVYADTCKTAIEAIDYMEQLALAAIARHLAPGDDLVAQATAALEGVTPGPWGSSSSDAPEQGVYGSGYRVAKMTGGEISRDGANARFIAFARQWVPEAAARLSALTAERDGWLSNAMVAREKWAEHETLRGAAEAEADRLRDRLARLEGAGDDWDALMSDARAEAEKAMRKFPQPNYVISKIAEEAGEGDEAAIHCAEGRETADNLRGEMKQALAMLYRLWVEGDQVHGLPPVRAALAESPADVD